jgi:hypothetical protein
MRHRCICFLIITAQYAAKLTPAAQAKAEADALKISKKPLKDAKSPDVRVKDQLALGGWLCASAVNLRLIGT